MTREEFVAEMQEVLQTEEALSSESALEDLAEWDSLAIMATVAFLDRNFGVKMKLSDIKELKTIGDIAAKAGL